jgi:glucose/arabinose dehydrogenase
MHCHTRRRARLELAFLLAACALAPAGSRAQSAASEDHKPAGEATRLDLARASPPLGAGPWVYETAQQRIRVSVITADLVRPFSLAFLPNGDMLVTELPGRLRLVHDNELDPEPITGTPSVYAMQASGLKDIALDPKFEENRWVYLAYVKGRDDGASTTAIARGKLEGHSLVGVRDIFVADAWTTRDADTGTRLAFGRDGMLYVSLGDRFQLDKVQNPANHFGKVLRLRNDGSVPADNPFVGKPGFAPEIYTLGHRNPQGLAVHPETGVLWSNEHGPQGGDELNILRPGANYGWPLATYGVDYGGAPLTATPVRPDMEGPRLYWVPGIAPSGLVFYTGAAFAAWHGNVFIGAMGRSATGHLRRLVFDANGYEVGQEALLTELHQRIRDVRQGPDGLLYLLTDETPGALLKIEPAPQP